MGKIKEIKTRVEKMLHDIYVNSGIDVPLNHTDILNFVFQNVMENADLTSKNLLFDVRNSFLKWIEKNTEGNETPEEKFARENAQIIFEIRIEGEGLYIDDEMSKEFIEGIVDDPYHMKVIKNLIRLEILEDVKTKPDEFHRDANGNLTYDADMLDYGFILEDYCREMFRNNVKPIVHDISLKEQQTKCVMICSHCGSDNVQLKAWVNPNKNNEFIDLSEDEIGWCNDCDLHAVIDSVSLKSNAKVIGFQVVGEDGHPNEGNIHPSMDASFCIYSLPECREMLAQESQGWQLLTIWKGDVEEPTMMFKGDPRK